MAYTHSGWYAQNMLLPWLGTVYTPAGDFVMTTDSFHKISLLTFASVTDYATPVNFGGTAAATVWVNTFETTGTGWSTGGVLLSAAAAGSTSVTPTFALGGSGPYYLQYTWTNNLSVSGTTLAGVGGCIIYNNTISAPNAKPMLLSLCFGAGYSTTAGTFGITPSGSGLSQITLTQ